jgi:hypothetical protein
MKKWPRFLILEERVDGAAGPKSQDGKMKNYAVYQYSNSMLSLNSTFNRVLEIEAFVVALIWSPGLIYATDWIFKYSPTV